MNSLSLHTNRTQSLDCWGQTEMVCQSLPLRISLRPCFRIALRTTFPSKAPLTHPSLCLFLHEVPLSLLHSLSTSSVTKNHGNKIEQQGFSLPWGRNSNWKPPTLMPWKVLVQQLGHTGQVKSRKQHERRQHLSWKGIDGEKADRHDKGMAGHSMKGWRGRWGWDEALGQGHTLANRVAESFWNNSA
jgi:hypothetical protein